jgi:hypothetical protein
MSITDQATIREYRHPTTGDANNSSSLNNKQSSGVKRIHPASNAAITNSNISYATSTINSGIISLPSASTTQFNRQNFVPRPSVKKNEFSGKSSFISLHRIQQISEIIQ